MPVIAEHLSSDVAKNKTLFIQLIRMRYKKTKAIPNYFNLFHLHLFISI